MQRVGDVSSSSLETTLLEGAYRLYRQEDVEQRTALAESAFPAFASRITCFGADWLGRQFATDRGRIDNGEPLVLMLEPGTGEALQIPANYAAFHERELLEYPDAVAAYPFFRKWLSTGGSAPTYDRCIGYRTPLFLGGADEVHNLEVTDFDVYWTLMAGLLSKSRRLPPGTFIRNVTIRDRG